MDKKVEKRINEREFLRDVLICSLGAYGGPEAHYGVFMDQLVEKKKYIDEKEFLELMSLTQILPGPSSTQTIVAIGHKLGGEKLALFTVMVWALPVILFMTLLSFMGELLEKWDISNDVFRYIQPMAVAFILVAAYRLGKKMVGDNLTLFLFLLGTLVSFFFRNFWIFPVLLMIGGGVSVVFSGEKRIWSSVPLNPPWKYLAAFSFFAIGTFLLGNIFSNRWLDIFQHFYQYGYMVIGGGQVVVPLMNSDLVETGKYMSQEEFLTGFGLVQGLPGPMFSFSAYAGGLAARGTGVIGQALGAFLGAIGIFSPGLLLIYFVYPIWEGVKKIRGIKISLTGITSVAAGLILASGLNLLTKLTWSWDMGFVLCMSCALLISQKVPAPILVLMVLLMGYFLPK